MAFTILHSVFTRPAGLLNSVHCCAPDALLSVVLEDSLRLPFQPELWFSVSLAHSYSLKVKVLVAQSCLTLCDPMDCSPPGFSVFGVLWARILASVAIPFSRGSSQSRDRTWVSHIASRFFTIWATRISCKSYSSDKHSLTSTLKKQISSSPLPANLSLTHTLSFTHTHPLSLFLSHTHKIDLIASLLDVFFRILVIFS